MAFTALDLPVPASPYKRTLLAGRPSSKATVLATIFSRSRSYPGSWSRVWGSGCFTGTRRPSSTVNT